MRKATERSVAFFSLFFVAPVGIIGVRAQNDAHNSQSGDKRKMQVKGIDKYHQQRGRQGKNGDCHDFFPVMVFPAFAPLMSPKKKDSSHAQKQINGRPQNYSHIPVHSTFTPSYIVPFDTYNHSIAFRARQYCRPLAPRGENVSFPLLSGLPCWCTIRCSVAMQEHNSQKPL